MGDGITKKHHIGIIVQFVERVVPPGNGPIGLVRQLLKAQFRQNLRAVAPVIKENRKRSQGKDRAEGDQAYIHFQPMFFCLLHLSVPEPAGHPSPTIRSFPGQELLSFPAVRNIHYANIKNRIAIFGDHLPADVVHHPDRAVPAHNPVRHPVNGVPGAKDLRANLFFHPLDVLRVHHGFEGAAHILVELRMIGLKRRRPMSTTWF